MRITLASLHPRPFSGQVHSLRALARVLSASGDDVRLRTVAAPDSTYASRPGSIVSRAGAMLDLLRTIARDSDSADLVHLCLPTPGFSFLGDWLAARIRVPLVVGYEAPLVSGAIFSQVARDARREPGFYLPRLVLNNRVMARVSRHQAGAYVVSTSYQQSQLDGLGVKAPIEVVPNVVDLGPGAAETPAAARREVGLPENAPLVGYVGHFHPVKGVDTLGPGVCRATDPCVDGSPGPGLERPRRPGASREAVGPARVSRRHGLAWSRAAGKPSPRARRARSAVPLPNRPERLPKSAPGGAGHRRSACQHADPSHG